MNQETYDKFKRVAVRESGRRFVDSEDLLQDVLVEMYQRGLDPEENQGLVIQRLRYVSIDRAKTQISTREIVADLIDAEKAPAPSFEVEFMGGVLIEWVRQYIADLIDSRLEGTVRAVARAYYLDGKTYNEMSWSNAVTRNNLALARETFSPDDRRDISAWDDFNRAQGGRRRLDLVGAPRLRYILIREGML